MKKYYVILLLIIILITSSCSGCDSSPAEDAADGVSFDYFITYGIDETNYEIYLPNDIQSSLYYTNKVGNVYSKSFDWTVNFIYEATYHVDESNEDKEVWSKLFTALSDNEELLEEKCGFDVLLFEPYLTMELEYVLNNETKEEATYVIFNTYIPVRVVNTKTGGRYTVGIPVKMDVLLKIGDTVEDPFGDTMISWEDFLAI